MVAGWRCYSVLPKVAVRTLLAVRSHFLDQGLGGNSIGDNCCAFEGSGEAVPGEVPPGETAPLGETVPGEVVPGDDV